MIEGYPETQRKNRPPAFARRTGTTFARRHTPPSFTLPMTREFHPSADGLKAMAPDEGLAVVSLVAAMTRWEFLTAAQATSRVRSVVESLGLGLDPGVPTVSRRPDLASFETALTRLRGASRPVRELAMKGALELATGSGTLPLAQNLALRLVAEALGLESSRLNALFLERTGASLPEPWDPSDPEAWLARQPSGAFQGREWDDAGPGPAPPPPAPEAAGDPRIARIKALALLGLEEGASEEDIRKAFRRVSKVHHPDRYSELGPEVAAEATDAFRRIKDAYDFLLEAGRP
jgi:DnaJ like chaperone protein